MSESMESAVYMDQHSRKLGLVHISESVQDVASKLIQAWTYGSVRLIAQAICFDDGFNFGGYFFCYFFTDLGKLGQNWADPHSMAADLFGLGELGSLKRAPKQLQKTRPKTCSSRYCRRKMIKLDFGPRTGRKVIPRPSEIEDFCKRQLSVRNVFLSYPWMAARKFYGVTGQLKGHSHMFNARGLWECLQILNTTCTQTSVSNVPPQASQKVPQW